MLSLKRRKSSRENKKRRTVGLRRERERVRICIATEILDVMAFQRPLSTLSRCAASLASSQTLASPTSHLSLWPRHHSSRLCRISSTSPSRSQRATVTAFAGLATVRKFVLPGTVVMTEIRLPSNASLFGFDRPSGKPESLFCASHYSLCYSLTPYPCGLPPHVHNKQSHVMTSRC